MKFFLEKRIDFPANPIEIRCCYGLSTRPNTTVQREQTSVASGLRGSAPVMGPRRRPLFTRIPYATPNLFLKHHVTVATYKRRQMKHLKQTPETLAKTLEKHLRTIANICNIQMKHSQTYVWNTRKHSKHMLATCMYMQHPDLLLQHPDKTLCNIHLERMKHLEYTLKIYVYRHYNMCNILIYFCNIDIQHLQHTSETSETLETYEWRLVDTELDAGTELDAAKWCGGRLVWSSLAARTSAVARVGGWS
jgi:hypothetical protein